MAGAGGRRWASRTKQAGGRGRTPGTGGAGAGPGRREAGAGSFFFQAEDGIRDYKVTGVQTCALPICLSRAACNVGRATSRFLAYVWHPVTALPTVELTVSPYDCDAFGHLNQAALLDRKSVV